MDRASKRIIAAYGVAATCLGLFLPSRLLSRLFQDDAFFYLAIARNFAGGRGSTFDGLHLTNGYHPLWMFLLAAFDHVVALRGIAGLRAVAILDGALFAASLAVLARLLARVGISPRLRVSVLVAAVFMLGFANLGMEAGVWLLSFCAFSLLVLRATDEGSRPRDFVFAGATAAACYLSRSDSVLFIVPMAGYASIVAARRGPGVLPLGGRLAALWGPVGAAGAAQVALNLHYFGSAKTISSELKTNAVNLSFQMLTPGDDRGFQALMHRGVFLGVFLAAIALVVVLGRERWKSPAPDRWRALLVGATAYIVVFCAAALLTLREPPRTWYYTVPFAILLMGAASLAETRSRTQPGIKRGAYALTALVSIVSAGGLLAQYGLSPRENSLGIATWLRDATPPETIAYVTDGSGIVGYFSERRVIDGDGLVNDFAFKRAVEEHRLEQYLRENQVAIMLANVSRDPPGLAADLALYTPSWHGIRSYPFARVATPKALADFTWHGHFGFLAFNASDLRFPPAP